MADPSSMFDRLAQGRQQKPQQQPTPPKEEKTLGRKRQGKRSDPNYIQVGAYIPKDLNNRVKRLLFDDPRDFSKLVADLLEEWTKQQSE